MSLFKKISLAIAIIVASAIACETPDTSVDTTPLLTTLLFTQLTLNTESFNNSCDRSLSASICDNVFRTPNAVFSPDCRGTVNNDKCTASTSVGVCIFPSQDGGHIERVYYSTGLFPTLEAQARSFCANGNGNFITPYVP